MNLKKIQGLIIGAAVGDAIGFVIEFKSRKELLQYIKELYKGKLKTITHRTYPIDYKFGQYSDDTQFSVLLIRNILNHNSLNQANYFKSLCGEFTNDNLVGLGGNTKKILKKELFSLNNYNTSNGSLMRSYPVGLMFPLNKIKEKSKQQSEITHNSEESILACSVFSMTVNYILNNKSKNELVLMWNQELKNTDFLKYSLKEFIRFAQKEFFRKKWDYIAPGALISLYAALYVFHHYGNDYKVAIKVGLFLGGDTDTVCSLIGGLVGASQGLESIPTEWSCTLYDKNQNQYQELIRLSDECFNFINKIEK